MRVDLRNQIINEISNDGNDAFAQRRWYLSDAIVDQQQKGVQLIELPVLVGCRISVQRRVEIHQFDVTNSREVRTMDKNRSDQQRQCGEIRTREQFIAKSDQCFISIETSYGDRSSDVEDVPDDRIQELRFDRSSK